MGQCCNRIGLPSEKNSISFASQRLFAFKSVSRFDFKAQCSLVRQHVAHDVRTAVMKMEHIHALCTLPASVGCAQGRIMDYKCTISIFNGPPGPYGSPLGAPSVLGPLGARIHVIFVIHYDPPLKVTITF